MTSSWSRLSQYPSTIIASKTSLPWHTPTVLLITALAASHDMTFSQNSMQNSMVCSGTPSVLRFRFSSMMGLTHKYLAPRYFIKIFLQMARWFYSQFVHIHWNHREIWIKFQAVYIVGRKTYMTTRIRWLNFGLNISWHYYRMTTVWHGDAFRMTGPL